MSVPKVCNPWIIQGTSQYLAGQAVYGTVQEVPVTQIPVGKAPFPDDARWGKALASWVKTPPAWAEKLGRELELALSSPRGPLLTPREAWNNLQDRGVLLKALTAASEREARSILGDWLMEKGFRYQGAAIQAPGIGAVTAAFLNYERPVRRVTRGTGPVLGDFTLPERAREALERVLQHPDLWPRAYEILKNVGAHLWLRQIKIRSFLDEMRPFAARHWGPRQARNLTVLDVHQLLLPQLTGKEREAAERILKRYNFLSWDDPRKVLVEDLRNAMEQDARERIEALTQELPKVLQKLVKARTPWLRFTRMMALAVPRFLAENVVSDSIFKPLLTGMPEVPGQALREMRAYYGAWRIYYDYQWSPEAIREAGIVPKTALQLELERAGIKRFPAELSASFERGVTHQELQARGWRGSSLWDLPLLGRLRDLPEPLRKVSPLHWLASWESWIMLLARSQESATRLAVFGDRYLTLFEREGLPAIEGLLGDLFETHGLNRTLASALMKRFRGMPDRSPEALADLVRSTFPSFEVLARQAEQLAREVVRELSESALQVTRTVNYDYLYRTNADEALAHLFKFHFWASRNLPFYLEEFAKHHVLFRSWLRYQANREQAAEEGGWPARLDQMAPVLDLALFGQSWTLYLALWAVISVTAQMDPPSLGGMGTPWEKLTRVTAGVGFSPHWDLQMLMALLGYDTRDLPPIFPLSRSLQRQFGINLNPLARGLMQVREQTSGRLPGSRTVPADTVTGSMAMDRLIWRELVLMSYEDTGRPNHPRYQAALVNPEDPLFQEAMRRVMLRQGVSEFAYLFLPVRAGAESRTELELRRQMAQHPAHTREEWLQGLRRGDPARWTSFVPSDIREAQIQAGFALQEVAALQGLALDPAWAQEHLPYFVRYLAWRGTRPPGQRSLSQFLAEVR